MGGACYRRCCKEQTGRGRLGAELCPLFRRRCCLCICYFTSVTTITWIDVPCIMGRRKKVLSSCSYWSFHVGKKLRLNDSSKVKHVISGRVNIRNVCLLKLPRISDPTFSSRSTLLAPSYHSTIRGCLTPPYRRQHCQKMSHWGPPHQTFRALFQSFPF